MQESLTTAQQLGFHGCPPPPMIGTNQARPGASCLVGQGWSVQLQEPGCDLRVDGGWLTMALDRKGDPRQFHLLPLTAPDWCTEWAGASLYSKEDARTFAQAVIARDRSFNIDRPARIFHVYAGIAEPVEA